MNPTEHKEFVQEAWREATGDLIEAYLVRLASPEATIDDLRKALELANRVTGAEADKKVDPNAGLSVFNFTFSNGGVTAVPVVELAAPDVADVTPREVALLPLGEATTESAAPNRQSMEDMMAGLDVMLGDA